MNSKQGTNNNPATLSKKDKVALLIMTILVALLTPVLLQSHLNVVFRDLFSNTLTTSLADCEQGNCAPAYAFRPSCRLRGNPMR